MTNSIKTISLKPTPEGYARSLLLIITNSESMKDRNWATEQVIGYVRYYANQHPEEFHMEAKKNGDTDGRERKTV